MLPKAGKSQDAKADPGCRAQQSLLCGKMELNASELKWGLPVSGPLRYESPGRHQSEHHKRTGMCTMKSAGVDRLERSQRCRSEF